MPDRCRPPTQYDSICFISLRAILNDTLMANDIRVQSWTLQVIPKSVIYTPKRDDEHPCPFHMGSPPQYKIPVVHYFKNRSTWNHGTSQFVPYISGTTL